MSRAVAVAVVIVLAAGGSAYAQVKAPSLLDAAARGDVALSTRLAEHADSATLREALCAAAKGGHLAVVKALHEANKGAMQNCKQGAPWVYALASGKPEVFRYVADAQQFALYPDTCHFALANAAEKAPAFIDHVLAAGCEPNGASGETRTALHYVAKSGDAKAIAALLAIGADPRMMFKKQTPADVADGAGFAEVAKTLREAAAQWAARPAPAADAYLDEPRFRDLDKHTLETLAVLRNEVYARHGNRFRTKKFRGLFEQRPWYRPRTSKAEVPLEEMTAREVEVIRTIRELEKAAGGALRFE